MSAPKHTAAPWLIRKCGVRIGEGLEHVVCAFDDYMITSKGESSGNEKADARLIAASPRMYEELEKADALLRRIEDWFLESKQRPRPEWFGDVQTTIAGTSAALAKAGRHD